MKKLIRKIKDSRLTEIEKYLFPIFYSFNKNEFDDRNIYKIDNNIYAIYIKHSKNFLFSFKKIFLPVHEKFGLERTKINKIIKETGIKLLKIDIINAINNDI